MNAPNVENDSEYTWHMVPLPFEETLADVLAAWRRHGLAAGHSDRTIDSRAYTLKRLAASGVDPLTADRDALTDWLADLRDSRTGEQAKRSSKATYRAQIRAFYAWMVDTGRREDDPTLKLPRPKPGRGVPRPVSPEQVRLILDSCRDPRTGSTAAYVTLAAFAGLRVHEIAKVRGEDFQGDELLVRGKGDVLLAVPLHDAVAALAAGMPRSGYWFPSSVSRGHVDRSSVSSAIKRAMVRAGVPGTPHALRHHFGTQMLLASGGDLLATQQALRHASSATTQIYAQVANESLKRGVTSIRVA